MTDTVIAGAAPRTARPVDLDAQLVATTGCASHEIETILSAGADRAAHALRPFLGDDAPDHQTLARAIAADRDAPKQIRALYASLQPAEPAPTEDSN